MLEPINHDAFIKAWMARTAVGRSSPQLIELLAEAMNTLCATAQKTLGEVTLTAIVDRVLHEAGRREPFLAELTFESNRVHRKPALDPKKLPPEAAMQEGLRFVLAEFLTVLGNLTAEILTPAFHGALSKLADASPAGEAKDK